MRAALPLALLFSVALGTGCPGPRPIGDDATPPGPPPATGPTAPEPDPGPEPEPPAEGGANLPVGASCERPDQCTSGICEGEGCTADAPGTCADQKRMCTRDMQAYCDCNGESFYGSGSCPGKRFAHRGACPGDPPLPGGAG